MSGYGDACRVRNANPGTLRKKCRGPAASGQRRQNAGVSTAMKLKISSRPNSMASVHTHI